MGLRALSAHVHCRLSTTDPIIRPEWRLDMFIRLYCVIVSLKFISTRNTNLFSYCFTYYNKIIITHLCVTSTSRQNNGIMWMTHFSSIYSQEFKNDLIYRGCPKTTPPPQTQSTLTFKRLRVIKRNLACEVISRTFWHNLRVRLPPQIRFVRGESITMNLPPLCDT